MRTAIVWFRNDLRVHDHPALMAAIAAADRIVPLFIFNQALLTGKHASANRNRFLVECLQDLQSSLQKIGGDLLIRSGEPKEVLSKLIEETGASELHYSIDYTPYARKRDREVARAVENDGLEIVAHPGRLIADSFEGVLTGGGKVYKVFTPFWRTWAKLKRRQVLPAPAKLTVPQNMPGDSLEIVTEHISQADLSPNVLKGGETAGRERLEQFMKTGINNYAQMHDSLTPDGTSRLSPYLHFGCVSPREIEDMLRTMTGDSAARFHRQLAWRDFYNYVLLHYPDNATQEFQERFRGMEWSYDETALKAWQRGKTGYPIIDAAMRQLNAEGWMHNRARLIVGSFLTKDLLLDWRLGETHFMRMLLDGDEANNNGNWQWIASVGVDPAPVFRRLYNPMTQQKRYDEDGSYVRYYVPELSKVPDKYLAEPWTMPPDVQQEVGCVIGKDYPEPIVDHAAARIDTLERFRVAGRP